MRSENRSLKAHLRGGVVALTTGSIILAPALAGAQSYHGETTAKAGAAPTVATRPYVATPSGANDNNTRTPVKHVIIIVGENRSLDHEFATYVPPSGDSILNILSEGVINADGASGPNFARAVQKTASDTTVFSSAPKITGNYGVLPAPNLNFTPNVQSSSNAPFQTIAQVAANDYGILPSEFVQGTTGASHLPYETIDTRIAHVRSLHSGPFQLSPGVTYDDYANSPVHRFYQMFQQLDCSTSYATPANPSGCRADLFPWVEVTVGAGTNGNPQPPNFTNESTHEGATSMGFYNVQQGDEPYFYQLVKQYTLLDNYHQPIKGGTGPDSIYLGAADSYWYSDGNGHIAKPPANQIENPNPQAGTNNWWIQDGYSGGTYSNCSDPTQPGVGPINAYLFALHVRPNCVAGAYYMLNNLNPGYLGDGELATAPGPYNQGPFTIPPVSQPTIADVLIAHKVSWAYYGEGWNAFLADPDVYSGGAQYCNICNPFLYTTTVMTGVDPATGVPYRAENLKDTTDLYNAIATSTLPAVSYVKPSGLNDGHPESSKISLFEDFAQKIVQAVQANPQLKNNTAIFITYDEGGGYWDSGYVQQVDFFGDGTRIPMIIVSPWTRGGHVSHVYSDHASVPKFIEANWRLPTISGRTRDTMPNPITSPSNPYVPLNGPALSDMMAAFRFQQ
jgi:phospholipase C